MSETSVGVGDFCFRVQLYKLLERCGKEELTTPWKRFLLE